MKFTKKSVTIDASQWFKNGDHPDDKATEMFDYPTGQRPSVIREGEVVRYYRHPDVPGDRACEQCGKPHHDHGWIDTFEQGHRVCPGDWIITGVKGERYPCKPEIFAMTYGPAQSSGRSMEAAIAELRAVNACAFDLTAKLCAVPVVKESHEHELIRREQVMELVTQWRMKWDARPKRLASQPPAPQASQDAGAALEQAALICDGLGILYPKETAFDCGYTMAANRAAREIRELAATMPSAAPSGWKLVPVGPTHNMLNAGDGSIESSGHCDCGNPNGADADSVYRAMLAAAPAPH